MFTILPTIEDADTTCPKDTTASLWNKSGLPGTPASPGPSGPPGRGRHCHVAGPAQRDPCGGGTGTTQISYGSRQHQPRQRITNRDQLQLDKPDPNPDDTLAAASVLGQVTPVYLQALQEPESPPWAIRQQARAAANAVRQALAGAE